jgi:hypothetical protein
MQCAQHGGLLLRWLHHEVLLAVALYVVISDDIGEDATDAVVHYVCSQTLPAGATLQVTVPV